jgi:DNA-binding NarL/FixJ family response regulator
MGDTLHKVLVIARTSATLQAIKRQLNGSVDDTVQYIKGYKEALMHLQSEQANLIIISINTHHALALETAQIIAQQNKDIALVVICNKVQSHKIEELHACGIKCLLPYDPTANELHLAISAALGRHKYVSQHLVYQTGTITEQRPSINLTLTEALSDRELEVLEAFCDGLGLSEVADALHISEKTVETHKKNMLKKFNVNALSKMIALAFRNKIVE